MSVKKNSTSNTSARAKPDGATQKEWGFTGGNKGVSSASMKAVGRSMARVHNQRGGK